MASSALTHGRCNIRLGARLPAPILGTLVRTDLGFPSGSDGKESASNAEGTGSIPESGRSRGVGNGNPLSILAKRNPWTEDLAGYSRWGCKESNTTSTQNLQSRTHLAAVDCRPLPDLLGFPVLRIVPAYPQSRSLLCLRSP